MAKREMRINDVQNMLRQACEKAGSQRAFALEHGLAAQYLTQVLSGERPPSAKLCEALGIEEDGMRWVRR